MDDKLKALYKALKQHSDFGPNAGTEEEFTTKFTDPENLKKLYGALKQHSDFGPHVGEESDFLTKFSVKKKDVGGELSELNLPQEGQDPKAPEWTKPQEKNAESDYLAPSGILYENLPKDISETKEVAPKEEYPSAGLTKSSKELDQKFKPDQKFINKVIDSSVGDKMDYFTNPNKDAVKERIKEQLPDLTDTEIDTYLAGYEQENKKNTYFENGLAELTKEGFTPEILRVESLAEPEKMFFSNKEKEISKIVTDLRAEIAKESDKFNGTEEQYPSAGLTKSSKEIGKKYLPNIDKVNELKDRYETLTGERNGWLNYKTGYRNSIDPNADVELDMEVNAKIDQLLQADPTEQQLRDAQYEYYVIYESLKKKLDSEYMAIKEQLGIQDMPRLGNRGLVNEHQAIMDASEGRLPYIREQLTQAKDWLEITTRALKLNEDPSKEKKTFFKKGKTTLKAAFESLAGPSIAEGLFKSDITDRNRARLEVSQMDSGAIPLTKEQKDELANTWWDKVREGTGNLGGVVGQFMLFDKIAGGAKIPQMIKGVSKAVQGMKWLSKVAKPKTVKAVGDLTQYVAKLTYEGEKFEAIGGDFQTGANFTMAMDVFNALPLPKKLKYIAAQIPYSLAKGSLSMTTASNATEMIDIVKESLLKDKGFQDLMEVHYGENWWEDRGSVDVVMNTMFGVPELAKIYGVAGIKQAAMERFNKLKDEGKKTDEFIREFTPKEKSVEPEVKLEPKEAEKPIKEPVESKKIEIEGKDTEGDTKTIQEVNDSKVGLNLYERVKIGNEEGYLGLDGQTVVVFTDGKKIIEVGNKNDLANKSLKEAGLELVDQPVLIDKDGRVKIYKNEYSNPNENPTDAIEYNKDGSIKNVTLENNKGEKRTFRGQAAEDIAYEITLNNKSEKELLDIETNITTNEQIQRTIEQSRRKNKKNPSGRKTKGQDENIKDGRELTKEQEELKVAEDILIEEAENKLNDSKLVEITPEGVDKPQVYLVKKTPKGYKVTKDGKPIKNKKVKDQLIEKYENEKVADQDKLLDDAIRQLDEFKNGKKEEVEPTKVEKPTIETKEEVKPEKEVPINDPSKMTDAELKSESETFEEKIKEQENYMKKSNTTNYESGRALLSEKDHNRYTELQDEISKRNYISPQEAKEKVKKKRAERLKNKEKNISELETEGKEKKLTPAVKERIKLEEEKSGIKQEGKKQTTIKEEVETPKVEVFEHKYANGRKGWGAKIGDLILPPTPGRNPEGVQKRAERIAKKIAKKRANGEQTDGTEFLTDREKKRLQPKELKIRKKVRTKVEDDAAAQETSDPVEIIKQYFIEGGKLSPEGLFSIFGTTGKENDPAVKRKVESERKPRTWWAGVKGGKTPEKIAHELWEDYKELGLEVDQWRDLIEEVVIRNNSPIEMAKSMMEKRNKIEEDFVDTDLLKEAGEKPTEQETKNAIQNQQINELVDQLGEGFFPKDKPKSEVLKERKEDLVDPNDFDKLTEQEFKILHDHFKQIENATTETVKGADKKAETSSTDTPKEKPIKPTKEVKKEPQTEKELLESAKSIEDLQQLQGERKVMVNKAFNARMEELRMAEKEKSKKLRPGDSIRQLKFDDKTLNDATRGIPVAVWNGAVELVATAVDGGMALSQAIKSGIDRIKKSEWYKGLDKEQQKKAEKDFTEHFFEKNTDNAVENVINADVERVKTVKQLREQTLSKIAREIRRALEDMSANLRERLNKYGDYGKDAINKLIIKNHGVNTINSTEFKAAQREILGEDIIKGKGKLAKIVGKKAMKQAEQKLLAVYIDMLRTIEIDNIRDKKGEDRLYHEGGATKEIAQEFIKEMNNNNARIREHFKVNDIDMAKLNKSADAYFEVMRNNLKKLRDAGIISETVYEKLKTEQPYYSKRMYIQHLIEIDPLNKNGQGSLSGIYHLEEGSVGSKIVDLNMLLADNIGRTNGIITRNDAIKSLSELGTQFEGMKNPLVKNAKLSDKHWEKVNKQLDKPEGEREYIKPNFESTPQGYQPIDYLVDGKRKRIFLDAEMAKEFDLEPTSDIQRKIKNWIQTMTGASILKAMATGYNPEFAAKNILIDIPHILMTTNTYSPFIPLASVQLAKDMAVVAKDVWLRKGRVEEMRKEGAMMEFLTLQGQDMWSLKPGKHNFSNKNIAINALKEFGGYLGTTSEMWTRAALRESYIRKEVKKYKKSKTIPTESELKQIKKDASMYARDYLDFAQGGYATKFADSFIPYFNAGIQVTRGMVRGARRDPGIFLYKALQVGGIAAGIMAYNMGLYGLGSEEERKEKRDFYNNKISDQDKNNNFIFMTNISEVDNNTGEKQFLYLRVPKDNSLRLITAMFESTIGQIAGNDPEKAKEQLRIGAWALGKNFSDIATMPPIAKAFFGYTLNIDPFYDSKIWRGSDQPEGDRSQEYYPGKTDAFFKMLGDKTGLSPVRSEFFAKQFTTKTNMFADLLYGGLNTITPDKYTKEIADKSIMQQVSKAPFARRFLKTTNSYVQLGELEKMEREVNKEKTMNNHKIDKVLFNTNKSNVLNTIDEFFEVIKDVDDPGEMERMTKRYVDKVKIKYGQIPAEIVSMKFSKSPKARADYFYSLYKKATPEKRLKLIRNSMVVGGIITKGKFKLRLAEIDTEGILPEAIYD